MSWFMRATQQIPMFAAIYQAGKAEQDAMKQAGAKGSGGSMLGGFRTPESLNSFMQQFGTSKDKPQSAWMQNYWSEHGGRPTNLAWTPPPASPLYGQNLASLSGVATPAVQSTKLMAPDGTVQSVRADHVNHYLSRGARRVDGA